MKNQEATQKTTTALLKIARRHFTQLGYFTVSLEKIAEEAQMTRGAVYHHFKNKQGLFLAVLDEVQKDVAQQIEREAQRADDPWQQLILGCVGFIKGANAKSCRRILLVDAPAVVGWEAWRKADQENTMSVLLAHINELKTHGYIIEGTNPKLMTLALSGALNELALNQPMEEAALLRTITQLVSGFRIS